MQIKISHKQNALFFRRAYILLLQISNKQNATDFGGPRQEVGHESLAESVPEADPDIGMD